MDIENKLKVTKGEREWRRDKNGSLGLADTNYCVYIYIKEINNKDLLYSTGNYIQCPVINQNEKEYVCICTTEPPCCTPEANTTL